MNLFDIVKQANQRCGYAPSAETEFGPEFDKLVYDTFSTVYGKVLLEFLEENLLMKAVWNPDRPEVNCYFREGRNNLVRLFVDRMAAYKRNNTC